MNRLSWELSDLETEYTQGWLAEMRKKREHFYEVIKNTTTEKELLTLTWYLLKKHASFLYHNSNSDETLYQDLITTIKIKIEELSSGSKHNNLF